MYVLIIVAVLTGQGISVSTAEFNSMDKCVEAGNNFVKSGSDTGALYKEYHFSCSKK